MQTKINFKHIILILLILTMGVTSCSKKILFQNSSIVPAARGKVTVSKDKNANYRIKVFVENLAEVNRLSPPNKTYVIWMQTSTNDYRNIGQMESSTSLFSSKLKATFETVSASKPIKILITTEDSGDVAYPLGNMILETDNF